MARAVRLLDVVRVYLRIAFHTPWYADASCTLPICVVCLLLHLFPGVDSSGLLTSQGPCASVGVAPQRE